MVQLGVNILSSERVDLVSTRKKEHVCFYLHPQLRESTSLCIFTVGLCYVVFHNGKHVETAWPHPRSTLLVVNIILSPLVCFNMYTYWQLCLIFKSAKHCLLQKYRYCFHNHTLMIASILWRGIYRHPMLYQTSAISQTNCWRTDFIFQTLKEIVLPCGLGRKKFVSLRFQWSWSGRESVYSLLMLDPTY